MSEERTQVDFDAPASLVERADAVADLLDISRTQLLVEALENRIDDLVADERFRRKVKTAYYEERTDFRTVASILGTEEAMRIKLLRESLARDPPEPVLDGRERDFDSG